MYDVLSIRGQLKLLVYYTVMRTHTQLTIIIQIESYTNKYPTSPHATKKNKKQSYKQKGSATRGNGCSANAHMHSITFKSQTLQMINQTC